MLDRSIFYIEPIELFRATVRNPQHGTWGSQVDLLDQNIEGYMNRGLHEN